VRASAALWPSERREAVQEAAAAWRDTHRLNAFPLEWGGLDGCTLRSRQWVEVEGGRIEIYPKIDKSLLNKNDKNVPDRGEAQSTLHTLLRLLEASNYGEWVETDRAALDVADLTFVDLWAYLLARHLWPQLRRGLPSAYLPHEDDLTTVRGRILVGRQIGRYQDRFDRIVCAWDEFSPDTALLRLLKCACRLLRRRVSHPLAMGLLAVRVGAWAAIKRISMERSSLAGAHHACCIR
jgi:5-methylcytosine-specific restriction endonuclease McrBC regulatory subunit McrC